MCSYLACYKRAVRRKKLRTSEFREVKSRRDWDALKSDVASGTKVERVYVNPDESELIRDRDFVAELANHAREHHYVVELSGGLLSHAFYMLGKYGCDVECIDLFGVDDESIDFTKIVRDYIPEDIQARSETV